MTIPKTIVCVAAAFALASTPAQAEGGKLLDCNGDEWEDPACRVGIALLGSLQFNAQYGETDSSGRNGLFTDPIPAKFENEKQVGSFAVGWFGKPILRDALVAALAGKTYENQPHWLKVAVLDAVTLDLNWGMSRKFDLDELSESTDELEYSNDFSVTVQYTLPLDGLLLGGEYESP